MTVLLPGARAALVTPDGLPTPAFYRWFQELNGSTNTGELTDDILSEAVREIALALGSPDGKPENIPPQDDSFILNASPPILATGSPAAGLVNLSLADSGVAPGTYGNGLNLVVFQVDAKGRLIEASARSLVAGAGISLDVDPTSGDITISLSGVVIPLRITRDGSTRITRDGSFRSVR